MSKKILVIDDDSLVSKSISLLLAKKGFDVTVAENAIEALSAVALNNFDLIISDIRMPGDNGIIAVEKIQKIYREKNVDCAYIFLSGYSQEDTPAHAIKLGVNRFLDKPIDNDVLLAAISEEFELLEGKKKLRSGETDTSVPYIKPSSVKDNKRVVITGFGAVAPNGIGKQEYWDGLKSGKNCVDRISFFDCESFPAKAAAEIRNFDPKDYIDEKNQIKRMGRSSHLAVAGAKLAVKDAGLSQENGSLSDASVMLGSAVSGLEYVEVDFRALERGGVKRVRPFVGIAGFAGAISSEISRALRMNGQSITISTGCTSSTDAMGYALDTIRTGKAPLLITGGADACVTSGILSAFCQMGAVSMWEKDFHRASRPFNKDRDGFVISEGAWIYVFEELEHALKRNANIYAEVVGYSATCDAWHMAKPHPSGEHTTKAILGAIADANIKADQIDLFETYGNGTPVNDSYETGVVKRAFGTHAKKLVLPSIKSMIGHPLGASGAQQVGASLLAIKEGVVHPTINYEVPDPECDLDYVPNEYCEREVKYSLCSSIAFGAKNSAIVLKAYKE